MQPSLMMRACGHGPRKHPFALRSRAISTRELGVAVASLTRRLPQWRMDSLGLVGKLPSSPVTSAEPSESLTLIPMGAARLRITSFPVVQP